MDSNIKVGMATRFCQKLKQKYGEKNIYRSINFDQQFTETQQAYTYSIYLLYTSRHMYIYEIDTEGKDIVMGRLLTKIR